MKKNYLIVFVSVWILLSSCHSLVEDQFDSFSKKPVMNGLLQADSTFKIQISLTSNLTDSTPVYVPNAQVIIENNVDAPDTLKYSEKGWYVSPVLVKAGLSYSCRVNIPGFPQMSAQTSVPEPGGIDSVVFVDLAGRGEEAEKISSVEFRIPNNRNKKQFWEVRLESEGMKSDYNFETGEWREYYGSENEYIYMLAGQDSVLLSEANPLTVFSNRKMKMNFYKVKFYFNENYTSFYSNETPYLILRSVDESYYKYVKQYYIYVTAGEINIGQSAQKYPLFSNVKNGLGMFTGMSVTKQKFITNPEGE